MELTLSSAGPHINLMRRTILAPHTCGIMSSIVTQQSDAPEISAPAGSLDDLACEVNYERWSWAIVGGVFILFFVTDTIEHAFLPSLHLGHLSWFLTTALATILAFPISRAVLKDLERVHQRLTAQNAALVTQSEKLAQQSERLSLALQEAHHRIKNNLQTVASLLTWQRMEGEPSAEARMVLEDSVNRIRAIATVHDFLTRDSRLTEVNAADVVRQLTANVVSSMADAGRITLEMSLDNVHLSSQKCTSLALIANELIFNALEHAFPDQRRGHIEVALRAEQTRLKLTIRDDGVGLPDGFQLDRDIGTGLDVAISLAEGDLDGSLTLVGGAGTIAEVNFPRYANE